MDNLKDINKKVYEEYMSLDNKDELACPNIVSSNRFLNEICEHPILYIGQETNGWINYDTSKNDITLDDIEKSYDEFLIDYKATNTLFWRFLRDCINKDRSELYKYVVWSNTILIGKRYGKGAPIITDNLKKMSLEYLLFLYEYFEPYYVINVSGNSNPYYDITKEFLDIIGSNITYPTKDEPLKMDNNIAWTYHPMRLNFDKNYNDVAQKIYQKLK